MNLARVRRTSRTVNMRRHVSVAISLFAPAVLH